MAVPRLFGQPEWSGGVRSLSGDAERRETVELGVLKRCRHGSYCVLNTSSQLCVLFPVTATVILYEPNLHRIKTPQRNRFPPRSVTRQAEDPGRPRRCSQTASELTNGSRNWAESQRNGPDHKFPSRLVSPAVWRKDRAVLQVRRLLKIKIRFFDVFALITLQKIFSCLGIRDCRLAEFSFYH